MTRHMRAVIVGCVAAGWLAGTAGAWAEQTESPLAAAARSARSAKVARAMRNGEVATQPMLWRIEGKVPTYLFGTVHVPDPAVTKLHPAVERAFAGSGAVFTELPMDSATQVSAMRKMMLPGDKTLSDVIGQPLFRRLTKVLDQKLPKDSPPGSAAMLAAMLAKFKPWAAVSQLSQLEFLSDMLLGRKPLDVMLYERAEKDGKEVGGLETVDEQIAIFDEGLSEAEQSRLVSLSLDWFEDESRTGKSATRETIDVYLTGDLSALQRLMTDSMKDDPELLQKFSDRALHQRNRIMVDRLLARRAARPELVHFIAVGALHYAGDTGIIALLEQRGLKVTRIHQ